MTQITLDIHRFPCLNDNYGYLVHEPLSGQTAAIDTPDAAKYLAEADRMGWHISHILNTHWHPDQAALIGQDIAPAQQLAPRQEQARLAAIIQGYLEAALDTGIDA